MKFYDFEYDNICLSSYGFIICHFNGSQGFNTIDDVEIKFDTIPFRYGEMNKQISASYDSTLQTTFQICKNPCSNKNQNITLYEYRSIVSWLSRKEFKKLKFIGKEIGQSLLYYEAYFVPRKIEFNGNIVGIELKVITNAPFAHEEAITETFMSGNGVSGNWSFTIDVLSDEEGTIYPKMSFETASNGRLEIRNEDDTKSFIVENCAVGERIEIDYPFIKTNNNSHTLQKDFNFHYLPLYNSFDNSTNTISVSLAGVMKLEYSPIAKVGI